MSCCGNTNKLNSIIEGWKNVIFPDPHIELIAIERAKVCDDCEKNISGICIDCGCVLIAKCRSLSETCDKWLIDKTYE